MGRINNLTLNQRILAMKMLYVLNKKEEETEEEEQIIESE